jgi:hypothetical protein
MGDLGALLPEDPESIGVHILVGRLGQDPRQTVYLGHLPDDDTLRVIRVLAPHPEADLQTREQITNGLYAAKRVSGAHTVKLIEAGWIDDSPYIVREHVQGRSLRETVTADGPLTGDALERLAIGTLTALTAIHLSGLTHGALTPDTVLFGPDGLRVCDIGLGATDPEPDYRAPELLRVQASPHPGRPADLFSWAATIVYAATGRPPFGGEPGKVLHNPANLIGLPPGLAPLLTACLDKHPYERPDTRAAMLRLLGEEPAIRITGDGTWQGDASPAVPQPGVTVPQPVAPSGWGAPPLPRDAAPAPQAPVVLQAKAESGDRPKSGGFPILLTACVGVIALLSGLGLWAAGSYASLGNVGQAAAEGKVPHATLGLADQSGRGIGGDPADTGKVTVPWDTTPDVRVPDVKPPQPSTQVPTIAPPSPLTTLFVTPPPTPAITAPVSPTAVPAPTPVATGASSTPAPTVTVTATPTVEPTSTPATTPAPGESQTPDESSTPTTSVTPTPAPPAAEPSPEPPASRPNPYTPQQVCGTGYFMQRSDSFAGGTVYQFYNASTGSNCVVTMKDTDVGTATSIWATLEVQGGESKTDRGDYEYYAGPVFLPARGKCVRFTGGGPGDSGGADWDNCG